MYTRFTCFTGTKGRMLTQLEEQVMVERQKKLVKELQAAQQTLTADVKDKAVALILELSYSHT